VTGWQPGAGGLASDEASGSSLASRVYQQVEGLEDLTVVEAVSRYIIEPDVVIVLDSDPALATRRVVRHAPKPGTFYSPYENEATFSQAAELHRQEAEAFERASQVDAGGAQPQAAVAPRSTESTRGVGERSRRRSLTRYSRSCRSVERLRKPGAP